jgi:hypothetical protein
VEQKTMKRSRLKRSVDEHDLYDTVIKITPFIKRQFLRYSEEKGKNVNNVQSLAHGIRLAGIALAKRYGVKEPDKLCINYQ